MATHYTRCPGCGSENNDLPVYRCENDHQYCTACAITVSQANLVDPLGLFASKIVCPRCHADAGEIVGEIRKYGLSGNESSHSILGTGKILSIGGHSRRTDNTGSYLILGGITYLGIAGGALMLMEHVARFSFIWWLCCLAIVAGIPLYIVLAYVTWYATMAVFIIWVLMQIAEHYSHFPH